MNERIALLKGDIRSYYKGVLLAGLYIMTVSGILKVPVCPMVYMTGFPCPGCGITRAALLFWQGDFAGSFQMHPFFCILLAAFILAAVLRYVFLKDLSWMKYLVIVLAVTAIFFYGYRMCRYFPNKQPMVYYEQSVIMTLKRRIVTVYR